MQNKDDFIPVARPWLDELEVEAARLPILSGWVTQGPEVAAFEREFADYVGAKFACAVSSCTSALHLALLVVGVQPGAEVITASHSFIATANSIRLCGAIPVFVDIQPKTFNIDPNLVEDAISERTCAILCVHQMGMPCSMEEIMEIANRRSLIVVEDAACAIGSQILWNDKWETIGKPHGDIACFSFHPRKVITTGDGGMISTCNPEWDRQLRLLRQHGMSVPDTARHKAKKVIFESYSILGYNYRMSDIQAAVGRKQLNRLPEIIKRRRFLAKRYRALLEGVPGISLPEELHWTRSNWQSYCVRIPDWRDQREVMQKMLEANIATRRGTMCAHREPAYNSNSWSCGNNPGDCCCPKGTCARLSESEQAQDHCIVLPLFPQMTETEQDKVVAALHNACIR